MENKETTNPKVSEQAASLYEQITSQTIENIKNGNAPWQKDYRDDDGIFTLKPPVYNPASGKGGHVYAAFNRILLAQNGFADPRYMTFDQAKDRDLLVKGGSAHSKVVNFKTHEYVPVYDTKTGEIARDEKNRQVKRKVQLPAIQLEVHKIFNAGQLQTKNYDDIAAYDFKPDVDINYGNLRNLFNWADMAFNPDAPETESDLNFKGPWAREGDHYKSCCDALRNAVALAHAEMAETSYPTGSFDEARIKLTEQIATWLLAEELGVYHVPADNENRSQCLKYLEEKDEKQPFKLAACAEQADKIKDYVLDLENVKNAKLKGEKYYRPDPVDMAKMQLWTSVRLDIDLKVELDGKVCAQQNIYLDDSAKYMPDKASFGVKKDAAQEKWYLEAGNDLRPVSKYLALNLLDFSKKILPPEQEFENMLAKQGFELSGKIQMDGEYHNIQVKDGKPKDGVYRVTFREDKVPQLFFANNVTGQKGFAPYSGGQLTDQEIGRLKENAAKIEEINRHNKAIEQELALKAAFEKYNAAEPAPADHAFFEENGLAGLAHEIYRQDEKGDLLVPRVELTANPGADHIAYQVKTIQHINGNGPGYSEKGCKKTGTMFILDTPKMNFAENNAATIIVAQSLESGIVLKNSAMETPVVVAFEAFNIKPVAESVRRFYPDAEIYICPDHSKDLAKNESVAKAEEAGKLINAKVVAPPLSADEQANGVRSFNDLRQARCILAVEAFMSTALAKDQQSQKAGGFER